MPAPVPSEVYQLQTRLAEVFSHLPASQLSGLAYWVIGTVWARSACQSAVVTALLVYGKAEALRQRLREWLYDGQDRAAPCHRQLMVQTCFVPLLSWILSHWQGRDLVLAIDATLHGERVAALVVSVLYRGSALPVGWIILPANQPGSWNGPLVKLLRQLRPALRRAGGRRWRVQVLTDRGLWSPRLWTRIRRLGWHPLMRVQRHMYFTTPDGHCARADARVQPGQAWIGRGRLGLRTSRRGQRTVTLIAIWTLDQKQPWIVVSDLPPREVGPSWYALRMWIELGFRALKGVGWQWQKTRRTDPDRVARHWLVLAVATVWVTLYGTRAEDAQRLGLPPARLLTAPQPLNQPPRRGVSVFLLGLRFLQQTLRRSRLWRRLWLVDQPWPQPPDGMRVTVIDTS